MKITIESTPELAHANGLPVRVWTGKTDRGTPILALITRIAVPDNASRDEVAAFEADLAEMPTRVVDPSGSRIAAPRWCTICNARGQTGKRATFIASNGETPPLQWFECDDHGPGDHAATFGDNDDTVHPAVFQRASRESLEAWFARHELPVPGGAVDERGTFRGSALVREPWASIIQRRAPCEGEVPIPPWLRAPLTESLRRDEPSWLVKDFHALYRAALDVSESIIDPDRVSPPLRYLRAQLERLSAAFELCDDERRALSDRPPPFSDEPTLTAPAAERPAFNALRDATAGLDHGMRVVNDDGALGTVVYETIATTSPPLGLGVARAVVEALARQLDPIPENARHDCSASPRITVAVVRAVLALPHVVDAKDTATASDYLTFALRGAQLGWHVRHAHPGDVANVARIGAPLSEPHRSAFHDGYRIAVLTGPLVLNDAMREFERTTLVYVAPEQIGPWERMILDAVEAERAAAAATPEALAAHAFRGQEGGSA